MINFAIFDLFRVISFLPLSGLCMLLIPIVLFFALSPLERRPAADHTDCQKLVVITILG